MAKRHSIPLKKKTDGKLKIVPNSLQAISSWFECSLPPSSNCVFGEVQPHAKPALLDLLLLQQPVVRIQKMRGHLFVDVLPDVIDQAASENAFDGL